MTPDTKLKLTRRQVEEVMGRLDDLRLAEIIDTGASASELAEAKRWIDGDRRTLPDDPAIRPSVVEDLCDIMGLDEPEEDEARAG